ncbi:cation transporter [Idiomarina sp. ST10R2A5]|uniref:cation transporter n=1 Tax=Idiomarina sp. ST10R2A5 TaxID=3418368 RepID=UPI003EC540E2
MSDNEHRVGVKEVNLVIRHLKLESTSPADIKAAIVEIDKLFGLDAVSFDEKAQVLNLAYDASHLSLDAIEDVLHRFDIEIGHDWWTHIKEDYYKYVDQNVKDNASHTPWSCHQSPPGAGSKRK